MMRVTSTTSYISMREGLAGSLAQVADAQNQLASGKRISSWSDAPSDAVTASRYSSQQADWAAYQHSGEDASRWLNTADGALQSVSTTLQRVRQIATNGINGSLGSTSRDALAEEVTALRDHLVDIANSKIGDRGLFSGFQDTAVQQVNGTWSYAGDDGAVNRQIGPSMTVAVNLPGSEVFGFDAGSGKDLFSTLDKLAADLRSGNVPALSADQEQLLARTDDISRSLGKLGALENRVDAQLSLGKSTIDDLKKQRSDLADVDLAEATLKLQMSQTGYQAALAAASRSDLPSLADFLR
jgi:flagellar hook-associated protein 3 FlgL